MNLVNSLMNIFFIFIIILFHVCDSLKESNGLPTRTLGMYVLLADDSHANYTTNSSWTPRLYPYQAGGLNVLWFTFINPQNMIVPKAFEALALCRGQIGCPTNDQKIIFSIGGQLYSETTWPWLESPSYAEQMANTVVQWFVDYKIDGIDLDIEGNAGASDAASENAIIFVNTLKTKLSTMSLSISDNIITLPVYGYPQIEAEIEIVNAAWSDNGGCSNDINSIGIMVYQDYESLEWVKDYANATSQYEGFPITVNVPSKSIMVGLEGTATCDVIDQLADDVIEQNLGGIMVWYASVYDTTRNTGGLTYNGGIDDASTLLSTTGSCWQNALDILTMNNNTKTMDNNHNDNGNMRGNNHRHGHRHTHRHNKHGNHGRK